MTTQGHRGHTTIVAGVLSLAALLTPPLHAAPIATLDGGQLFNLNYASDAAITTSGTFDFTIAGFSAAPGTIGFLNVAADLNNSGTVEASEWLVQNIPLGLDTGLTSQPLISAWWDRDLGGVTTGNTYETYFTIEDNQVADPSGHLGWQSNTADAGTTTWGANDLQGQAGANPVPPSGPATSGGTIEIFLQGGVPDIAQKTNECGPTSAANSLRWLAEEHDFESKLPNSDDMLIQDLMQAMAGNKTRPFAGLTGDQLYDGKKKYIKDKDLPLIVKGGNASAAASGASMFDFIKKELKEGEDVEFLIGWTGSGAHWVTAIGYGINGDRLFITVNDPDDGKTGMAIWELDKTGTFKAPKGTALWAVSESYVPAPGAATSLILFAWIALRRKA
ncbi:MAG: hypothetical protein RIG82_07185 [Phycisphaeraceae bacterium]